MHMLLCFVMNKKRNSDLKYNAYECFVLGKNYMYTSYQYFIYNELNILNSTLQC